MLLAFLGGGGLRGLANPLDISRHEVGFLQKRIFFLSADWIQAV